MIVGAAVALAVVTAAACYLIPAQWAGRVLPGYSVVDADAVAFLPGTALITSERVEASDIDEFQPEGEILLLTVAIDSHLTVSDWILSSFDDSVDLHTRESVYGPRTDEEQRRHNRHLMESAKDTAMVVALEYLGVNAAEVRGVEFESAVADGPADGLLDHRELIVAIDGEPVTTVASLLALLSERSPGTPIAVTMEDAETGVQNEVLLTLGVHPDTGGAFMGVAGVVERIERVDLPFDLEITAGSVGGPSAGLAFALTVIDLLTPGELTGGRRVAVTGSIRLDGSVGAVGGVPQKAVAARDAGAEVLIVPRGLEDAARSGTVDVPVVGVATLEDALQALAAGGGDLPGRLVG